MEIYLIRIDGDFTVLEAGEAVSKVRGTIKDCSNNSSFKNCPNNPYTFYCLTSLDPAILRNLKGISEVSRVPDRSDFH